MNKNMKANRLLPLTLATLIIGSSMPNALLMNAAADAPVLISAPITSQINLPSGYLLNDKQVSFNRLVMPYATESGEVFLPLRKFSESLDSLVKWNGKNKTIEITSNGKQYVFNIAEASKGSKNKVLKSTDGSTYETQVRFGSYYVKSDFFQRALGFVVATDHLNQLRIDSKVYSPNEASTVGEIIELIQGKDGIQILVKGQKYGEFGYSEISASLTKDVAVNTSAGEKIELSSLKVGDSVYIQYNKGVTKSLPPMSQAQKVIVLNDESVFEGKVYFKQLSVEKHPGADNNGIAAPIKQLRVIGNADYVLHVNDKTVIVDQNNKPVDFDQLNEGSIVQVFTAPYAAMSYPAQTTAYRIVVISLDK